MFFRCLATTIGFAVLVSHSQAQSVGEEWMRIENRRQQLQAGFAIEDAACRQKFAANDCLNEMNAKQLKALAELRGQEISLNDDERKRRGAEQIRRIEEKRLATNHQELTDRRIQTFSGCDACAIEQREAKKKKEQVDAKNRLSKSSAHMKEMQEKQLSFDKQSTSDAGRSERHFERQNQARERLIKHDDVASKRSLSTAKSLPVPP